MAVPYLTILLFFPVMAAVITYLVGRTPRVAGARNRRPASLPPVTRNGRCSGSSPTACLSTRQRR